MTLTDSSSLGNRIELVGNASNDDSISLADACRLLPCQSGKRPHLDTVRRWTKKGVRSVSGQVVKLRTFRLGGRSYTKISWINEFVQACTDSVSPIVACRPDGLTITQRRLLSKGLYGKGAKKQLLGL